MSNTDFTEQAIPDVGRPQPPQQPRQGGTMPAADMPDAGGGQPPQPGDQAGDLGDQLGSPWSRKVPTAPPGGPRQPYMRSRGPYRPSDWGQPDYILSGARNYPGLSPGPWMPQLQDVSPLVRQAVQYLTQHGSGPVAAMAANMGLSRGAYDKAFIQGQIARAKYEHEQYAWHQEALIQKQTEELREAAAIYDAYQDDPHQMQQKLLELAQKNQDDKLAHVVQNGSLQGVKHYLDERNVYLGDLSKIAEQRDKHRLETARADVEEQKAKAAKAEDDAVRQYFPDYKGSSAEPAEPDMGPDPPPDQPPSAAAPPEEQQPDDTQPSEAAPAAAPPSPPGAPPAAAGAGGPATPAAPGTPSPAAGAAPGPAAAAPAGGGGGAFPALPSGQQVPGGEKGAIPLAQPAPAASAAPSPGATLSESLVRGMQPGPKEYPEQVMKRAALDAVRRQGEISNIIAEAKAGRIKPDQVESEVAKRVGPAVAADLNDTLHYRTSLPSGGMGGGNTRVYNRNLAALATAANPGDMAKNKPGWSQSTFDAVKKFRDDSFKTNSPIQRIPSTAAAAKQVAEDIRQIKEKYKLKADFSQANIEGQMRLDPGGLYAALGNDWLRYNQEVQVLITQPSVTETEQGVKQVPWYANSTSYLQVLKRDMGVADAKRQQLHNSWDQFNTGDPMPGWKPDADKDIDAVLGMDPVSGMVPGDILPTSQGNYRYTGKNHLNPDAPENWERVK